MLLPRTERAPALLHIEQTWLPMLGERLPLPTPTPVRIGKPSSMFEHIWTIARWVEGEPADRAPITRMESAEILAGFLRALHHAVRGPANPSRGIPLAGLRVDDWFEVIADHADADAARESWEVAVAAPAWQGAPVWLHLIAIGANGRLGMPGGKPTWEPAGYATLDRVLAAS